MALSVIQQLARLVSGGIFAKAREFLRDHAGGFRGFWRSLQYEYGLSQADAINLARVGRQGVQAAQGLGGGGDLLGMGDAREMPYWTGAGPGVEPTDRVHYHLSFRYRRGGDDSIQNRQLNVFTDVPVANEDLLSAALAELQRIQAAKDGSPKFNAEEDVLLDWEVNWVVSFRPLP